MKASQRKPNRRSIANPRRQPMPVGMKFSDFEWEENQKPQGLSNGQTLTNAAVPNKDEAR